MTARVGDSVIFIVRLLYRQHDRKVPLVLSIHRISLIQKVLANILKAYVSTKVEPYLAVLGKYD